MVASQDEYIEDAYGRILKVSADEKKRLLYEARQKAIMDHKAMIEGALDKGRRQGMEQGMQAGLARGKADSTLELLEEHGAVSDELRQKIIRETDLEILKRWHKLAARTESIEEFESKM